MNTKEARQIIRNTDDLRIKDIDTDGNSVTVQVVDANKRRPEKFTPKTLAELFTHDKVNDVWVENDKLFVHF